ncbi:MAG: imidazole glycerol phosphate synthase subunit HisH [Verrucomicrobiota bacterium]
MSKPPLLGLVDYGSGNLRSVQRAIEHAGGECTNVQCESHTTGCAALVVPGVGSFGDCARQLRETGLWAVIKSWIGADKPYLGICLGYQLLFDSSEESPGVEGLGALRGKVVHFPKSSGLKIPHMGWNQLHIRKPSDSLITGLGENPDFYFVHSYYPVPEDDAVVTTTCNYGVEFAASVTKGNLSAVQFHPEKSQELGLQMLRNFISSL